MGWGAIISAGASLLGGAMKNRASRRAQERSIEVQDPVYLRKRYEAAGLNPAMIGGNAGGGSVFPQTGMGDAITQVGGILGDAWDEKTELEAEKTALKQEKQKLAREKQRVATSVPGSIYSSPLMGDDNTITLSPKDYTETGQLRPTARPTLWSRGATPTIAIDGSTVMLPKGHADAVGLTNFSPLLIDNVEEIAGDSLSEGWALPRAGDISTQLFGGVFSNRFSVEERERYANDKWGFKSDETLNAQEERERAQEERDREREEFEELQQTAPLMGDQFMQTWGPSPY